MASTRVVRPTIQISLDASCVYRLVNFSAQFHCNDDYKDRESNYLLCSCYNEHLGRKLHLVVRKELY